MQKVVTINLNGNAYQVDEDAYGLIDKYLGEAAENLAPNPDINEIMSDLEQALADKLRRFLGANKTVVNAGEVREVLTEMGPVDPGLGTGEEAASGSSVDDKEPPREFPESEPRRLYRLKDEAMIEGVCAGIAAYLGLDPTIVRIIAVVLLAITGGTVGAIYILLLMVVPEARTPEEKAAAYGAPFNAQDVIDQAKSKFEDMTTGPSSEKWKRHLRAQQRYWQRHVNDSGNWLPFVLLFFGMFFLVAMLSRTMRPQMAGVPFMSPFMGFWGGPWFPILVILVGLSVAFSARGRNALTTVLSVLGVLIFLAFAFATIPAFQILVGNATMWWCRISPWGC